MRSQQELQSDFIRAGESSLNPGDLHEGGNGYAISGDFDFTADKRRRKNRRITLEADATLADILCPPADRILRLFGANSQQSELAPSQFQATRESRILSLRLACSPLHLRIVPRSTARVNYSNGLVRRPAAEKEERKEDWVITAVGS
jgi:hypothetical protein